MIDHLSLGTSNLGRATSFYDAVLAPLGYVRLWSTERGVGYGITGSVDEELAIFAIDEHARAIGAGFHLAIEAPDRASVDSFHAVATGMGAVDEGAPGLRPRYGDGYYAAFVRDLDGHKIEAVCHER
ncbi:MAG: VOC family protein [Polyangiales bacterium]